MGAQGDGCAPSKITSPSSYIEAPLAGRPTRILIDTGASLSFISKHSYENDYKYLPGIFTKENKTITAANGSEMKTDGYIMVDIDIGNMKTTAKLWILENLCTGVILGLDWLTAETHKINIDFNTNTISVNSNGKQSSIQLMKIEEKQQYQVRTCEKIVLNPKEQRIIQVKTTNLINCDTAQFTPTINCLYQSSLMMPHALIKLKNHRGILTISNISNTTKQINKNTPIGLVEQSSPHSSCFFITTTTNSNDREYQEEQHRDKNKKMNEQVKKVIDESIKHLNQQQQLTLSKILYQHNELFDLSKPKIANTPIHHTIPTGDHQPVNAKPYRVNQEKQNIIEKEVNKMEENGLIKPSQSPWSSPVLLVKKRDGQYRFCVDYRNLNQITTKDSYPLPNIEDTVEQLGGSSYFSKLDLKNGYFQVRIAESDKPKTAFNTGRGLWEFNVLPQGLKNSPPSFQRILNNLLGNNRWSYCLIYLDDVVIYSKTFDKHCTHINEVLSTLNQANFQLNPSKCSFARNEIEYLGHSINHNGYKPLRDNIDAIMKTPNPRTARQVHSFLQMANFYRKFISNFTELTRPLRPFQKKHMKFYWGPTEQTAWDNLKQALTTPPVFLYFPVYDEQTGKKFPYVLSTDASQYGIAGALKQQTPNGLKPIVYISRTLSTTERNYSTFERECRNCMVGKEIETIPSR